MDGSMTYDVFISHSSKDNQLAESLYEFLTSKGLSVWLDRHCIRPGEPYAKEIMLGLSCSSSMLLMYSHDSSLSVDVKREVANADKYKIPVVVFKIDNTPLVDEFEYYLAMNQWVSAGEDPTRSFDLLHETLTKQIGVQNAKEQSGPAESSDSSRLTCKVTFKHVLVAKTGYYLLKGLMDGVEVRLLGSLANVRLGSVISATGYWTDDEKYGREFRVVSWCYAKDPEAQGTAEQQGSRRPHGKKSGLSAMIRIVRNELKNL